MEDSPAVVEEKDQTMTPQDLGIKAPKPLRLGLGLFNSKKPVTL